MVIGCFSLLTLCYLDVFHCERYVIWMFFTVNVMLIGCFHCERYVLWMFLPVNVMIYIDVFTVMGTKKDVGLLVIFYFINMIKLK